METYSVNNEPNNKKLTKESIKCKIKYIVILICVISLLAGWCIAIWSGHRLVEEGNEYKTESTEEQCFITNIEEYAQCECACHCDTYNRTDGSVTTCVRDSDPSDTTGTTADTCYSKLYTYTATVQSKCGSTPLTSHYIDGTCCDKPKILNKEYDCFVLDCIDKEFTFTKDDLFDSYGKFYVVLFSICLG
eukprot:232005_1